MKGMKGEKSEMKWGGLTIRGKKGSTGDTVF